MSAPLWVTEGALLVVTVSLLHTASWVVRWHKAGRELDALFWECYLIGHIEGMHACAESRVTVRGMARFNTMISVTMALTLAIIATTYLKMR